MDGKKELIPLGTLVLEKYEANILHNSTLEIHPVECLDIHADKKCTWIESEDEVWETKCKEGAKEAFETVVQHKHDLETECKRLSQLLE